MKIIIKDSKRGKEYLISGHRYDYEIFKRDKKGKWVTARLYPTTISVAVMKCINLILADPDDGTEISVDYSNKNWYKDLCKVISNRTEEIVARICKEGEDV